MAIASERYEEVKDEAKHLGVLLDGEVLAAVEANNKGILKYVVNRLEVIKKCIDRETI